MDPVNTNGSPDLAHARFDHKPNEEYLSSVKALARLTGYEQVEKDFGEALRLVNDQARLGLSPFELEVFSVYFTSLSQVARFRGDPHIEEPKGENSATHCLQGCLLIDEVYRRAGIINGQSQGETEERRIKAGRAMLDHDAGEIFGELSSVAQRVTLDGISEAPDVERLALKYALSLAVKAVENKDHNLFYDRINELRSAVTRTNGGVIVAEELLALISGENLPRVSVAGRATVNKWLNYFDISEMKDAKKISNADLFTGYLVKAIEHCQGSQHYVRLYEKAPGTKSYSVLGEHVLDSEHPRLSDEFKVPANLALSARLVSSVRYAEGEVGKLHSLASSPEEKKLAIAARDMIYNTVIELLDTKVWVFDRRRKTLEPELHTLIEATVQDRGTTPGMAEDTLTALRRHRDSMAAAHIKERHARGETQAGVMTQLCDIETRSRMQALYRAAILRDYSAQPGEILLMLDKLPPELGSIELPKTHIKDYVLEGSKAKFSSYWENLANEGSNLPGS